LESLIEEKENDNNRTPNPHQKDENQEKKRTAKPRPSSEKEQIERICQSILEDYEDMLNGVPEKQPPFREINHKIPLIDENKRYNYHLPRCAEIVKNELLEKTERYLKAGWWESKSVPQAAPLLVIRRKMAQFGHH
jgi:hypothetical protein